MLSKDQAELGGDHEVIVANQHLHHSKLTTFITTYELDKQGQRKETMQFQRAAMESVEQLLNDVKRLQLTVVRLEQKLDNF